MDKERITFRCPTAILEVVDEHAAADHRDRTSMLIKMIDFYVGKHPIPNGKNNLGVPTAQRKKKAGSR